MTHDKKFMFNRKRFISNSQAHKNKYPKIHAIELHWKKKTSNKMNVWTNMPVKFNIYIWCMHIIVNLLASSRLVARIKFISKADRLT